VVVRTFSGRCAVRVINVNDTPACIGSGACIAEAEIHHGHVVDQEAEVSRQTDVDDRSYDHVKPLIDSLPAMLQASQREQAVELIKQNADVFLSTILILGVQIWYSTGLTLDRTDHLKKRCVDTQKRTWTR